MTREDSGVYRRSFKNYLLNLRYQLKFTLTMVGISIAVTAGLTTGLGYIIMSKVREASRLVDVRAMDPTDELAQQLAAQFANNDRVMLLALIGFGVLFGLLLSAALTVYGIILTHKVAGPLYKISLYLDKIRDGKLGTVYNLRKGDELVDFFEHFKGAHDALRHRTEQDMALIDRATAAAERAGDAALVDDLKRAHKQKGESLA